MSDLRKNPDERTLLVRGRSEAGQASVTRLSSKPSEVDAGREVFVHATGVVDPGARIGDGSRVEAFAHVLGGATIGRDCNIGDYVYVGSQAQIGDRVDIMPGVQIGDNIVLEDEVIIGPNATFTYDLPSQGNQTAQHTKTIVRQGASIGANATITAGTIIGRNSMVSAGAVVANNVPPYAIVSGNPARITGYVSSSPLPSLEVARHVELPGTIQVRGVQIYTLPVFIDLRGNLSVAEFEQHLPFLPKRYFLVFDVPNEQVRGEHAHKTVHQFLVSVKGSCSIVADDGKNREEFLLDKPNVGLYVPPMIWATQYNYSQDGVLLVLASEKYDPEDYIRDYDEYIEALKSADVPT